ncbi:polysaccharide deacetylase family protein [Halotia wernerae UHCC 0503]|nr:polysaccharide deacetylase family protein [Halotia wernerae UHCC 0503]
MSFSQQVAKKTQRQQHAFTVDVEDWYHGAADEEMKVSAERRLHYGLGSLLEFLAEYEIRGTFFWLGQAALDSPHLVKEVAKAGHEIGCHGWFHEFVYKMSPQRFKSDTQRTQELLADLTGKPVVAYRAPYFSITRSSLWALEILAELGFRYDSSIFPVRNWRYGIADFNTQPQQINTPSGSIYEIPLSIRQVLGQNIPMGGGAYFRLYPYMLTRNNFLTAEREGRPVVFYIHPWELDPDHPPISLRWKERLTHNISLRSTKPKLQQLLQEFSFTSLGEILDNQFLKQDKISGVA